MMTQDAPDDIFSEDSLSLYTITSGRSFLDDLASALFKRYQNSLFCLTDVTIFLPTRRAARALSDAFLKISANHLNALLLPQVRTLGDIDEHDAPDLGLLHTLEADFLPPVSAVERRLALANFIFKKNSLYTDATSSQPGWAAALSGADELAALLDSFHAEQVSFEALSCLVPEQYADHWNVTLEFLKVISTAWPHYLAQAGKSDPAAFRRVLIDTLGASWDQSKGGCAPKHPVIIAGSTGSMPAVARLMRLVAEMPKGCVVLPGLDLDMDEAAWQEIEDPHPQAGLKNLLDKYFAGLSRTAVREWPVAGAASVDRSRLLSLAMRPAEATADWLTQLNTLTAHTDLEQAITGLGIVEASTETMEAQAIALALREAISVKNKTALLVTPDRELARRVSLLLKRWDIQLDDSAGVPFANTLRGNFLRLVAAWLAQPSDPVILLSMLKHPLCAAGFDRAWFSKTVRELDLVLRGLHPGADFEGLRTRCAGGPEWDALPREEMATAEAGDQGKSYSLMLLLNRLEEIALPESLLDMPGRERLQFHLRAAEQLAATDAETGKDRLWAYEDGEAGAALLAEIFEYADLLPVTDAAEYAEVFPGLVGGVPVRQAGQLHPRLQILGPLEARLQNADLVILGGLNEGTWPDEARTDSFLSRPMRQDLGLPSPERRVGLAAMDFAHGACAREVLITRSKRKDRAPTKPSRWLVRLKNILEARELLEKADKTVQYKLWGEALDEVNRIAPVSAPSPCPPVAARPVRFSVTAVEKLLRDPYSIFASYILGLKPLEGFDINPDLAIRGRFYHHLFARFALAYPDGMPEEPERILHTYAEELFEKANISEQVRLFWQARMQDSFAWYCTFHADALKRGRPVVVEGRGSWMFAQNGQQYELTARVDRIDQYSDGLFIYDYKTGLIPTPKQDKLFSPQLPLTAIITANKGFPEAGNSAIAGYAYLKALNRRVPDKLIEDEGALEAMREAEEKFRNLLQHYQNPSEPYLSQPRPFYRNDYGDYDHLARRGEWAAARGDD